MPNLFSIHRMHDYEYTFVQKYTLWVVIVVALGITAFAAYYAYAQQAADGDVSTLVDQVVQRQDLLSCSSDPERERECYTQAFPLVGSIESCERIPFTDIRNTCGVYFSRLSTLAETADSQRQDFTYEQVRLEVTFHDGSKSTFKTLVADTNEKRMQGLSYVSTMAKDEGMLFAFPPDLPQISFHMKDMLIPLDMIFITEDFVPVQSFRNLSSCAGSDAVCPLQERSGGDVQYVLEILPQGKEIIGVRVL